MRITEKYVAFYGYREFLSNFHFVTFTHKGQQFNSSEQAIMWRKALLFGAVDVAKEILKTTKPNAAKILGQSESINFDELKWEKYRNDIFDEVLLDKFSTYKMKKLLLATGDRKIIEASPKDMIWGVGMSEDHPDIGNTEKWNGLNLLGFSLERVRKFIKNEENKK